LTLPLRSALSQSLITRRAAVAAGPVDMSGTPGGSARSLTGGVGPGSFATVGGAVVDLCAAPHPAAAVTESAASTATAERPTAMG
jgi:hypothetical protein